MRHDAKTSAVLLALIVVFLMLAAAFRLNLWARPATPPSIPLVDLSFISNTPARVSYSELLNIGADVSDYDCYVCHERSKPPPLRFDKDNNLIIPQEHSNILMEHGTHNRNNLCFNCHNETNLELLQTRDGRQLKLSDSPSLCGSCHGPTFRDWEAGVHGRTGGYWNRELGAIDRKVCTSCHDPHSPKFPGRQPAPGPHLLHPIAKVSTETLKAKTH